MLDLRTAAVTDWLHLVRPVDAGSWPPPVRPVEATPHTESLLVDLGGLLERAAQADPASLAAKLQHPELAPELQLVFAQLGAARPLRVLHWLKERDIPDSPAIIAAIIAGDAPAARALSATIAAVTRRATLRRLFAPERLTELHTATATALKEPA